MSWDIFNIFGRRAPREAGQEAVVRDRPRRSSVRLSFRSSKRWNRGSHSDPQARSSSEEQRPTKRVKELTNGTEKQRWELQRREEELQRREEELQRREEELQWREEELRQRSALAQRQKNGDKRKLGKSSCRRCEDQARENRQALSEMEAFYKDKLAKERSALKEKEEQLRSFKDRVAQNVVLSLKTENTENMNSPVNQSRLTEMYQQLRVCTWPNIHFSASDAQARALVQKAFDEAAKHIKVLRTSMRKLCVFRTSPKVEKFRQTALENLQLALFHSSREDVFKEALPQFQAAFPQLQVSPEDLLLASECYWLGCLMALNSPPLRPDWDRADDQSVFPRDIRPERRRRSDLIAHV